MSKFFNFRFLALNLLGHPLFAGSFVMIFGSNAVSFLNYIYHFMMGRLLGPANYGELAAIISLMGLVGVIPGSLNLVVIKYISSAKDDIEISSLISWLKKKTFIASLIFSLVFLSLSPLISSFLHIDKIYYLILMALSFFFAIQSLLNRSILQGLLKFKEMVMSTLVENGIKLVAGIVLVYLGFQVGGAMLGIAIAVILGWYITIFFLSYRKTDTKAKIKIKEILMFTIPVIVQSVAITSLYSSDVLLVKHFFPTKDAGIYAALSNLGKIIFFGAGPIGAVMFPLVSKRKAKGERYEKIFTYSLFATVFLASGLLLIYWLFPQLAIGLLYGRLYLEASDLLVWFGIFMSLFTLSTLIISYGLSLGRTRIVILPLIAALAQVILIWFFHKTLSMVIFVSIIVAALLLLSLLIYSTYEKRSVK